MKTGITENYILRALPPLVVALAGLPPGSTAWAQSTAEEGAAPLEQIIVTARKREESLQDVPDAIVAISADVIERANITAARDVTARIPNVSIVESLSPTSTFIIVRGIASSRNSEPAVAVVVDGVQVGSASEVSQSYYDIEQIELLKGPQGALYGRNAVAARSSLPPRNLATKPRAVWPRVSATTAGARQAARCPARSPITCFFASPVIT